MSPMPKEQRIDVPMTPRLAPVAMLGAMNTTACLLVIIVALGACNRADDGLATAADLDRAPRVDAVREGLERAHHAYAAGQGRAMTRELLGVLQDPNLDEAARANALALADRAFAEGGGRLDTGFAVPAGMTWMRLTFQRADNDGVISNLAILNGGLEPGVTLRDVSLTRSRDGRVLASRSDEVGYFEAGSEGGQRYFYIHTATSPQALESGAYRLGWALDDGRSGAADVLVPGVQLDAVPEIVAPARGSMDEGQRPTFRWRLPGWASERATGQLLLDARVTALSPQGGGVDRWSMWEQGATRTEVQLGAAGAPGDVALDRGKRHRFAVQVQRRLQYGDLQLGGGAQASRSFEVGAEAPQSAAKQ